MNAVTKEEQTALSLPQRAAVALGAAEHELKLRELLTNSARITMPANKDARDECHAAYMVLKTTRISITKLADEATEDAKAFTKAVKAEALRLLAITEAEEARLQGLRDEWDAKVQAEKDARIKAERDRVEAIQARITAIQRAPLAIVGKSAQDIEAAYKQLVEPTVDDAFDEFLNDAVSAYREASEVLIGALLAAQEAEAESLRVKAAQEAEAARMATERAELARLRSEQAERIAEQERQLAAERAQAEQIRKQEDEKRARDIQAQNDAITKANESMRLERAQLQAERDALAEAQRVAQEAKKRAEQEAIVPAQAKSLQAFVEAMPEEELAPQVIEAQEQIASATVAVGRPSNEQIIQAVADWFDVPFCTAIEWVSEIEVAAAA